MLRRVVSLSLVVFLLAPQIAHAQKNRWQNLAQIKVGDKVKVTDRERKTYSGSFLRFSDTDLTLFMNGQETKIDKDNVVRVTTGPQHRARNALIGAVAGAAVGGAMAGCCLEHESGYAGAAAGTVVGLAAIGAGIGAIIHSPKTIYRLEEGKQASSSSTSDQTRTAPTD